MNSTTDRMFEGLTVNRPSWNAAELCPKCHGYGGWNIYLDYFGKGKHVRTACLNCCGVGYQPKACLHEWVGMPEKANRAIDFVECKHCHEQRAIPHSE